MLELSNVVASYGAIKGLKGVSIHVNQGELVTLVGANGSGKSTLLKSIIGMVHIDSGTISYKGENITGKKTVDIISRKIAIVPEGRRIFPDLTVRENLEVAAYAAKNQAEIPELMQTVFRRFPRLEERTKQYGGTLSGGEQQMLAVGRALMAKPEIILMDEPSMGLAPKIVAEVFSIIHDIKEMGITILLVEQNAKMALKIADRAYMIRTGNIVGEYDAAEVLGSEELLNAYLSAEE